MGLADIERCCGRLPDGALNHIKDPMKSVSAMKVASQLRLGFGGVLALLGIVVGVALVKVQGINQQIVEMVDQRYATIALLTDMSETLGLQARNLRNAIIAANDADELRVALTAVDKTAEENNAALARLDKAIVTPEARELFKKIVDSRAAYGQARDEVVSLVRSGNGGAAGVYLLKTARSAQNDYFGAIEVLGKYETAQMQQAGEQAKALGADAVKTTLALALLAAVVAVAAGGVITRGLLRQLGAEPADVVGITREVAAGNLAVEIRTRPGDSISILAGLRDMRDRLAEVVGQVRQSSESIATGSAQIATGNADLSHRTEEQASNLQQTAASMEQLTVTVKASADTAVQANQLAADASGAAVKGGEVVSQVVATMQDIAASSKRIADIIGVIDGIAFQTNILALNAAVEAARAGEQGRGFAVVASEVRSLAQRSANAAKEIKALIGASVEKVDAGTQQVHAAGVSMTEIVNQVSRVTQMIGSISHAAAEQSAGISQVGDAVGQLDQVTQQNAALVEESAAAAESLRHQAARLSELVSMFQLTPGGARAQARGVPAQAGISQAMTAPVSHAVPQPAKRPAAPLKQAPARAPAALPAAPATRSASPSPAATAGASDDWESF